MRYKILLFPILFSLATSAAHAQRGSNVFAITAENTATNQFLWTNINEVNVQTGQPVKPLYTHYKTAFDFYDGNTKTKRFGSSWQDNQKTATPQMPASFLIAAAAYDVRHNRLYMAPMQQPELRWIDLDDKNSRLKIYTVQLPIAAAELASEPNQLTRMVIAADGYGYALTNDGNHLFRFSTGSKPAVTDMGALQDAASNGAISIHVKSTSFGGDMVADAEGNLYLFSAYHSIFKIDVLARTATYTGNIKNLPAGFTTNGAAVDEDGDLVISTASPAGGFYKVNMNTWEAVKVTGESKTLGVSDLASSYFAFQKKKPSIAAIAGKIVTYPNPVTASTFNIAFSNYEKGRYTIQLMDATGRMVLQQKVELLAANQLANIKMPPIFSKGVYTVKVVKATGKAVYTNGILVN